VLRPRVLLSNALANSVTTAQLAAAIEHERAHLRRRDPLASVVLALASFAALPFAARAAATSFRDAAEEAADADAATVHGGIGVADALLAVARVQTRAPLFAFAEGGLERRVRALLAGRPAARARGLPVAAIVIAAGLAAALMGADGIHHAVESLLG
jgi:Zn-dependent protease with chaperone function